MSQDTWQRTRDTCGARYLDMAMDESTGVRKQDGYRVVVGVSK